MPKYKVTPIINNYCHRIVYFVLPSLYDSKQKSIEQLYNDSAFASFIQKESGREAIKLNLYHDVNNDIVSE